MTIFIAETVVIIVMIFLPSTTIIIITLAMMMMIVYNYLASANKLRKVKMEQAKYIQKNVVTSKVPGASPRTSAAACLTAIKRRNAAESEFVRVGKRVAREHAGTLRRLAER